MICSSSSRDESSLPSACSTSSRFLLAMITKLWFVQESSTFGLSSGETSETVPSVSMRIVLLLLLCTATVVPAEACTKTTSQPVWSVACWLPSTWSNTFLSCREIGCIKLPDLSLLKCLPSVFYAINCAHRNTLAGGE